MDSVAEIKARLPIEELVRQYCQLTKKGRNFVALCPFHHDTRPSFLISPDKGICYCFPCQKGGDIFSFYQQIEGVDFPQALKELAEKVGVTLESSTFEGPKKDEKERLRDCLEEANKFFVEQLRTSDSAKAYLASRGVTEEEKKQFSLGVAPDSFTALYDHLLKANYSRKEIVAAGVGVQKELNEERIYDRFRNRLMFPIADVQGRIIGFGGRTLANDDAKYLNSSESPLYKKSNVLFGLHHALKAMREQKRVLIVEGYFDVLACHRVGVHEVVATCGTALTEEHARLLKRHVDTVVLCLDQDRAGRAAAERAFTVLSKEDLQVQGVVLADKDPADAAQADAGQLQKLLKEGTRPYLDLFLEDMQRSDLTNPTMRHAALEHLLPLLQSISSATQRSYAVRNSALALGTTETALTDDLRAFERNLLTPKQTSAIPSATKHPYSTADIAVGLLCTYPQHIALISELIMPEDGLAARLCPILQAIPAGTPLNIETLELEDDLQRDLQVLLLYCEEQGFSEWNDSVAIREIRRNCHHANHDLLKRKQ
jgi:DNA primase